MLSLENIRSQRLKCSETCDRVLLKVNHSTFPTTGKSKRSYDSRVSLLLSQQFKKWSEKFSFRASLTSPLYNMLSRPELENDMSNRILKKKKNMICKWLFFLNRGQTFICNIFRGIHRKISMKWLSAITSPPHCISFTPAVFSWLKAPTPLSAGSDHSDAQQNIFGRLCKMVPHQTTWCAH